MKNILFKLLSQTRRHLETPPAQKWFNFSLVFLAFLVPGTIAAKIIKENGNLPYRMRTVVIDAGHGGHDPGCSGSDSKEKHIALAVAKKVAAFIQTSHPDLRVILTRDTDVFVPLHERAAIANRNHADLFISIHCNFMPGKSSVQGSETYVMGLHTAEHNLAVAKRENAAILLEENYQANYDYDPNSPEGHIMLSLFQNAFIEQSIIFADLVEKQFAQIGRKSRGVRQAGFVVLKASTMPSALIEIGFLSNKDEEDFLKGDEGQMAVTNAILNAFTLYRQQLESGSANAPVAYETLNKKPTSTGPDALQQQNPVVQDNPKGQVTNPKPQLVSSRPPAGGSKPEGIPLGNLEESSSSINAIPTAYSAADRSSWPETDSPKVIGASSSANQSSINNPQSATRNPQSAIRNPQSEIRNPQSEIRNPKPEINTLIYCIQLSAASSPADLNQALWKNLGHKVEEINEDGRYKYQIRNLPTYQQANDIRQKVLNTGFPGAFIVAYQNGKRISIEEALRISK